MSWHAADAIDEAVEKTRSFLFPFSVGRWFRLLIIVFLLEGAPARSGSTDFSLSSSANVTPELLIGGAVFMLVLFVFFGLIGSVMRFVLLESLRTDSIHLRQYFRQQFWNGVRLFLFETGVILVVFLLSVSFGLVFGPGLLGEATSMALVFLGIAVIVFSIGVLLDFTSSFVAPVMLLEDRGVIDGWQQFWPTLKTEWKQYVLYVLLNGLLTIMASIIGAVAIMAVGLLIVVGIVVIAALGFVVSDTIGLILLMVVGLLGVLLILGSLCALLILIGIYFRYYSLLVLGKTNVEFDLLSAADDPASDGTTVIE